MNIKGLAASASAAILAMCGMTGNALAADAKTAAKDPLICVFDFLGTKGPVFGIARELQLLSELDGVNFRISAYTSEDVASKEFSTGKCDGLVATGLRTRNYNTFAGSLEAIGAIPNYDVMRGVLKATLDKRVAPFLENDQYAVAGIVPVGNLYLYVNDKNINTLGKAAGKRVASMDYDKAQAILIERAGAQPVNSDVLRFAQQFNNNTVDVVVAPALAYRRLELYKGVGDKGGVIDLPIGHLTYQIIVKKAAFPYKVVERMRQLTFTKVDVAINAAREAEAEIPASVWMRLEDKAKGEYISAMRDARISLRDSRVYDGRMLTLIRKVRCQLQPADAECASSQE